MPQFSEGSPQRTLCPSGGDLPTAIDLLHILADTPDVPAARR